MIKLDKAFIQDLNLGELSDEQIEKLLQYVYEALEIRTGEKISNSLTDEQLDEFEKITESDDPDAALTFLNDNVPNYAQIVEQELQDLKIEVKEKKDEVLASL